MVKAFVKEARRKYSYINELLQFVKHGDIIEFFINDYPNYAIYIGSGCVAYVNEANEQGKCLISKEVLSDVCRLDQCRVNNLVAAAEERGFFPRTQDEVIEIANNMVGTYIDDNSPYSNSELFVTECRYGTAFTNQKPRISISRIFVTLIAVSIWFILHKSHFETYTTWGKVIVTDNIPVVLNLNANETVDARIWISPICLNDPKTRLMKRLPRPNVKNASPNANDCGSFKNNSIVIDEEPITEMLKSLSKSDYEESIFGIEIVSNETDEQQCRKHIMKLILVDDIYQGFDYRRSLQSKSKSGLLISLDADVSKVNLAALAVSGNEWILTSILLLTDDRFHLYFYRNLISVLPYFMYVLFTFIMCIKIVRREISKKIAAVVILIMLIVFMYTDIL